ncbi:MAG: glycosyltransferase family 2 protein [Pyrinomonadaceae bacterium]
MIYVFYFFAAILVWLSFKSFRGGITYLRFFREELAKPRSTFTPFVTIIAPCRGIDDGLEQNLSALLEQDFPAYEVIFVVDDETDPAVEVISKIRSRKDVETPRVQENDQISTQLVIAPRAEACAQKVANLREAVLHANDRSQAFVFVDSDARPSTDWLRTLVAPLADENVGAAAGYRWFISTTPTFASEIRSVWNASIASAFGPNTHSNFCWGGSTAIRRDVFERIEMREKWAGTLSDDFAVTRVLNDAKLPVVFVPQALTASVENCIWTELFEFTTRQMKITRVYMTRLWVMSMIGSAVFNAVMIAAFLISIFAKDVFAVFVSIATLVLVSAFSIGKSWLRLKAVKLALPKYEAELTRQFWPHITLWLFTPSIFLYNSLAAAFSRRLTWRGITYELKSPTETVIISH